MRRTGWAAIVIMAASAAFSSGQETAEPGTYVRLVESQIARVLVYSDRALVTRQVPPARFPPGRSRVVIDGLPGWLDDSSVRAALPAGSLVKIANIEVDRVYKTSFKKEESQRAWGEVKELEHKRRELEARQALVSGESSFIAGLSFGVRPPGSNSQPLPISLEAWGKLLDLFDTRFRSAAERERKIAEEIDDVDAALIVASSKYRMLQSYRETMYGQVILEIDSPGEAETGVEISYIVAGPGWFPRYDVRADVGRGTLELTAYALVRQETGEDWKNVEIAFSAAEPSRAADLPRLASWRIGVAEKEYAMSPPPPPPPPTPSIRPMAEAIPEPPGVEGGLAGVKAPEPTSGEKSEARGKDSRVGRYQQSFGRIESLYKAQQEARTKGDVDGFRSLNEALSWEIQNQDVQAQRALDDIVQEAKSNVKVAQRLKESARLGRGLVPPVRSSGGYDYRYNALRVEDVPSDGALTRIVILKTAFRAEFMYEVAPERSRSAFLKTKLKNTTPSPLLAGPVSVFLASDFVGETDLTTCSSGEELDLGLGADEEIHVTRDVQKKRDTRGAFGSSYKFDVNVAISVANNKARPVTLAVLDRMPFTTDNDLKIKEGAIDPPADTRDQRGLFRWNLTLGAREKRAISFAYSFEHKASRSAYLVEDGSIQW